MRDTNKTELKEQVGKRYKQHRVKVQTDMSNNTELKEGRNYNLTSITIKASAITAQVTCNRIKEPVWCSCAGIVNLCVVAR